LLGWSLGGQIALDLAAAMPARIDKLVLVATTPRFTAAPDWPCGMKADVITKMATQLRDDYQQTVRDFLDLQVRGSIEGTSVIEQLRNALFVHGQAKPEALEAGLSTLATSDLRPTLPHVRTPTLVMAGQNDRITAPAASRALAEALSNARYVEMRRAAHTPFLSHRKEFAVALERFLRAGQVEVDEQAASMVVTKASDSIASPTVRSGDVSAAGRATSHPVGPVGGVAAGHAAMAAAPSGAPTGAIAKKKRMKARARKKLQVSSR
jgi:pimeloyl-ACP methyl ester esterase